MIKQRSKKAAPKKREVGQEGNKEKKWCERWWKSWVFSERCLPVEALPDRSSAGKLSAMAFPSLAFFSYLLSLCLCWYIHGYRKSVCMPSSCPYCAVASINKSKQNGYTQLIQSRDSHNPPIKRPIRRKIKRTKFQGGTSHPPLGCSHGCWKEHEAISVPRLAT